MTKRSLLLIVFLYASKAGAQDAFPAVDCVISPSQMTDISAVSAGVIEQVYADLGDTVKAGQLLVELQSGVEKSSVQLAKARANLKADIAAEEVNLKYDSLQEKRMAKLAVKKLASEQNQNEASRIKELTYWRLQQIKEELNIRSLEWERAKAQLEEKRAYATFDGQVAERFKHPGEYVEGQPILRVVQLDSLHIKAVYPMSYYSKMTLGKTAFMYPETDETQSFPVVVDRIDPVGDAASGTFGVRFKMDNSETKLSAGLKCVVQFEPIKVPASSHTNSADLSG